MAAGYSPANHGRIGLGMAREKPFIEMFNENVKRARQPEMVLSNISLLAANGKRDNFQIDFCRLKAYIST